MRIALEGIPLSNGRYGNEDRKAVAKIGDKFEMKVDNATKKMQVYENDKLIKTFPVSLGKKSTPSSSGTMVVMDKQESTVFDTFAELGPDEGYRTNIDFAQRLTWGGEFIHSAPWSVGDQGVRNVSHGCVNLAPRKRELAVQPDQGRRPDHGQGHRAQARGRQRLDRLERDLGQLREGQRAARTAGSGETGHVTPLRARRPRRQTTHSTTKSQRSRESAR